MMNNTSPSLLHRLRASDASGGATAWAEFCELYTPLLFKWARNLGLQDADAADLVQDVLAALIRALPDFEYNPGQGFRAYMRTIALNIWRNRLRKKSPHSLEAAPEPAAETDSFSALAYRRELLQSGLARLQSEFKPLTWQVWERFAIHGQPADAVAAEFEVTVNAVYLAKSRILRRLREELAGLLD